MKRFIIVCSVVAVIAIIAVGAIVLTHEKASTNPQACINNNFTVGASGHCVSDLQNLLNWAVYGINQPGYMKVDGQYTSNVATVVGKFQTSSRLASTGRTTPAVWAALCGYNSDTPSWWTASAKDAGCSN